MIFHKIHICNLYSLHEVFYLKRHMQTLNESHKTRYWNYKLQLIMKIKRFNCEQCGKHFARGCNTKLLLQNVHEIDSWITQNTGLNTLVSHKNSVGFWIWALFWLKMAIFVIFWRFYVKPRAQYGLHRYINDRYDMT